MFFGALKQLVPVIKTFVAWLAGGVAPKGMLVSFEKFIHHGAHIATAQAGYGSNYCRIFIVVQQTKSLVTGVASDFF